MSNCVISYDVPRHQPWLVHVVHQVPPPVLQKIVTHGLRVFPVGATTTDKWIGNSIQSLDLIFHILSDLDIVKTAKALAVEEHDIVQSKSQHLLDPSKVYDSVDHDVLLGKLSLWELQQFIKYTAHPKKIKLPLDLTKHKGKSLPLHN